MNALSCSRFTALLIGVVLAFALPSAPVSAAELSAEVTAKALRSRAEAFEDEADFSSAAESWVELMAEDGDPELWLVAAYRAQQAFRTAANSEDDRNHLCRAREVIAEVLANDGLEADERADFEDFRLAVEADLIVDFNTACSLEQVPDLLPVHSQAANEAGPRAPLFENNDDTQPRPADGKCSALTSAGTVTLALAAPALGGMLYAFFADRALVREGDRLREDYDPQRLATLKGEAREVRGLAVGFGVTSAVLIGTGVGLVIAGRRQHQRQHQQKRTHRRLSILPRAGRSTGGITLTGRF